MKEQENLNARVIPAPRILASDCGRMSGRRKLPGFIAGAAFFGLVAAVSFGASASGASGEPAPLRITAQEESASLVPFLPSPETSTGCAVLIVPGSDARSERETLLARWLNTRGIAGFILRRGLQTTDKNAADTAIDQAVRYLRGRSVALGISSRRVGVLGFGSGAEFAAKAAYRRDLAADSTAPEAGDPKLGHPDFVALIGGSTLPAEGTGALPPTFLVGSARSSDGMSGLLELWGRLRAAHVPVDAHFFARAEAAAGLVSDQPSLGPWPEMLHAWLQASGFLTDATRVAIKGMVLLDGRPLAHGYVIFTPLEGTGPGTGPVIGRVLNATVGVPIGEFSLPAEQGPVAGRYRVDVRQDMAWWLSNAFSGDLVNARRGATPAQAYFGHHRRLEPSIDDQRSYPKIHPTDREDATIEFRPGAAANLQLKIEVFSR
jgi:hypothetical protein